MTIFDGPDKQHPTYKSKFLRTGEDVFVTEPEDIRTGHRELAEEHGIDGRINRLREESPVDVDGGYLSITNRPEGGTIDVDRISVGYVIPIGETATPARLKTAEVIARLSPGYEVNTDRDEFPGGPKFLGGKER